jgi:hypothetical protein
LRGAARTPSFEWQNPLGDAGDYICDAWTTTFNKFNNSSIRADFTRVYGTFLVSFAGYAPGFSEVISYEFVGGTASIVAPGLTAVIEAALSGGAAFAETPAPPSTGSDSSTSFWSDWAYYDPDIFLYTQAAVETPVYWNRWQSWIEDPPLLFEESS